MKWNRLKNFKCPECNSWLEEIGDVVRCEPKKCKFSIGIEKFNKIIKDLNKVKVEEVDRSNFT